MHRESPALIVLNPVSNFLGFAKGHRVEGVSVLFWVEGVCLCGFCKFDSVRTCEDYLGSIPGHPGF